MSTRHLPSSNGHPPDASPAGGADARTSTDDQPRRAAHSLRAARLLALTEPAPLPIRWGAVVLASLAIAGLGTLVLGGAPTYDPWAWIIWGREIIHGDLVTTAGPSWKPLPMFFTVPFALFGDAAPDLWMWIARATALVGIVAVADLAARLGGRLAASLAAVAIALAPLYYAYGVQGSAEGALVLVCSLAATSWLDHRRTASFWWLVAAALLRPEAWPFVALAGLERLRDRPKRLWWIAAAAVFVVVVWLVPEKLGSGAYLRAATRAHEPNPDSAAFASSPTLEVLGSMGNLLLWVPAIGVVLAAILGAVAWRHGDDREISRPVLRTAAFLGLAAVAWVAIVAAMTEGGYAGNPRYLAAPLGLLVAVALGGVAWLVRLLARRGGSSVAELLVMAALVLLVVVAAVRLPARTDEITWQAANQTELSTLASDPRVRREILACRPIVAHPLMVPPIAWSFGLHIDDILSNQDRLTGGTYIVGTNIPTRGVQPVLPAETPVQRVAESAQIKILRDCRP